MKLFLPTTLLFLGISLSAQMPGMMTVQSGSQGTALGANETLAYNGIALGNRVKMRGYVDFIFGYDDEDGGDQNEQFGTSSDLDFLFDLSPVTAEVHIAMDADPDPGEEQAGVEQAFGRYDFQNGFNVTFGRQLTSLGFEADEAPGLYAVSNAYRLGGVLGDDAIGLSPAQTRRNYKDGVRMNFNNGQFGVILGLHDGYWGDNDDFNGDNLAIDIAASVMIIPGLEARLGYAQQEIDPDSDISQFNAWIAYNPNDLTLAFEYDNFDIDAYDDEYWSMMLLASYQFTDWFAATLRYTHEDYENGADNDANTFTFATLFTLTSNFFLNVEYSTTDVDSATQGDYNEFFIEGLITY
tara:strand:- start:634 stop:1692 length:1059 start_codon:yes stop_codon:yes gene_type:complete